MKPLIMMFLIAIALAAQSALVCAEYPVKQVRIVVPFPPGGSTDLLARDLGRQLSPKLGTNFIVENRAGASGIVGTELVAKAAPDGGTLLFMATHHVINPSLYKNLPYDPRKDFTNVAIYATMPIVLVGGPKLSVKNVVELVALAKKQPGKLFFGSGAIGGGNHLAGELFNLMTGVQIEHVAYKGTAPALADLLGGHIPLMYDVVGSLMPSIRTGEIRPLAVTSRQRVPSLPDVPTVDETVAKGFEASAWFGIYGPAHMAPAALIPLEKAVAEVQASADTAQLLSKFDAIPGTLVGKAFDAFVDEELTKWRKVVERVGVKVE